MGPLDRQTGAPDPERVQRGEVAPEAGLGVVAVRAERPLQELLERQLATGLDALLPPRRERSRGLAGDDHQVNVDPVEVRHRVGGRPAAGIGEQFGADHRRPGVLASLRAQPLPLAGDLLAGPAPVGVVAGDVERGEEHRGAVRLGVARPRRGGATGNRCSRFSMYDDPALGSPTCSTTRGWSRGSSTGVIAAHHAPRPTRRHAEGHAETRPATPALTCANAKVCDLDRESFRNLLRRVRKRGVR